MSQSIQSPEGSLASYRLMVDSVADYAIIMLDTAGHVLSWNKGAQNIKGYTSGEIIGRHFSAFYPPDEVESGRPDQILVMAANNGKFEEESWRIRKDGSRFFASVVITALHDGEGRLTGFAKVTRDISERHRYEAALKEANERLEERVKERTARLFEEKELAQVMLQSIGDAVLTTDAHGRINFLNSIAEELTGWTTAAARGQPIISILRMVNETTREPVSNPVEEAIRENRIVELANHTILIARDGREIFIEDSAAPVRGLDGKMVGAIMVFHDVSRRKKAEKALRTSEETFRTTFEFAPTGMCQIAMDGTFLLANPSLANMLGYSLEELYQIKAHQLVHPEDVAGDIQGAAQLISGEIDVFQRIKRHVRKDQSICWSNVSASLVRNDRGEPAYLIATVADITERKKAEQALAEANHQVSNILESITDAFFAVDNDWRVTYVNHQAEVTLARSAEQLLGKNFWEEFPEAPGSRFYREYHYAKETGQPINFVDFYPPLNAWYEVRAYPHSNGLSVYLQNVNERMHAEEKLRQQAELLNLTHDAMIVRDVQDEIIYWNRGAEKLYGFSQEEAAGQIPHVLLQTRFPESLTDVQANLQLFGEWSGELTHTTKSGQQVTVLSHWVLERDSQGMPARILETNRDITDRKRFEQALRESEERTRSIIEQAAVGIAHTDVEGHFQRVNPKFCQMFGYSRQELQRRNFLDLSYWEDRALSTGAMRQLQMGEQSESTLEMRYVRKDGQLIWGRVTLSLAKDVLSGQPKNLIAILEDITERRRAQEALQQSLQENQKILDHSLDLIVILDQYGNFTRVSAASEKMLGYRPEELLGKRYLHFIHEEDIGKTEQVAEEVMTACVKQGFENRLIRKDGTPVKLIWTTTWSPEEKLMFAIGRAVADPQ